MSLSVFSAVLAAAVLHATWNALVKGRADKRSSMGAVILGHLPYATVALQFVPRPAPASLPYLLVGIGLHFGYQLSLLHAYDRADLTKVYPIARGSAPLIVVVVSVSFLGLRLAPMELVAVALTSVGIVLLALVRRADGGHDLRGASSALLTSGFIAAYTLVDGLGARAAGSAVGFYGWLTIGNGAAMLTYLRLRSPSALGRIARRKRGLFLLGGGASFLSYAIVTWAFTRAPIALVSVLRETSIVFALLIGAFALKERLGPLKVASTLITLLGLAALRASTG